MLALLLEVRRLVSISSFAFNDLIPRSERDGFEKACESLKKVPIEMRGNICDLFISMCWCLPIHECSPSLAAAAFGTDGHVLRRGKNEADCREKTRKTIDGPTERRSACGIGGY